MSDRVHGSHAGWVQHQYRAEAPCESCRVAQRSYDQQRASREGRREQLRIYARARSRAFTDLAALHRKKFDELMTYHLGEIDREERTP